MTVLRSKGFDGASINDMAEATGLKKASLYHRFPGGKKEIAEAVLKYVSDWNNKNIAQVLQSEEGTPKSRLDKGLLSIKNLYNNGDSICILRALTMENSADLFGVQIEQGFELWIESFTKLGVDFGFSKAKARKVAMEVIIKIQGSLVVSKGMKNQSPFQQAIKSIKETYTY